MELKTEIICENFNQKNIINNEIKVDEPSEEYYIIPLNKPYTLESDDEIFKLTFNNQLLYLKYSNHNKTIRFNEYGYDECVIIKSNEILDIYMNLKTDKYYRKNVWHKKNKIHMNKQYLNKYFLIIPIIEDMINIKQTPDENENYHIELITNEIQLKKVSNNNNNHGRIILNNNILLNKEALFIPIKTSDMKKII